MSDNIFSALAHRRTTGVIREFSLWCAVCFTVLLSLIAAIAGRGNVTWIMLMIFSIGLGVIMAFRLSAVAMLYSAGAFCFMTVLIHYISFSNYLYSISIIHILLFVLLLLVSIALVACEFIHFFTRFNFRMVIMILLITNVSMTFLLQILIFASGSSYLRSIMNADGYWVGTITFWMILAVVVLLHIFFFWNMIDKKRDKLVGASGNRRHAAGGNRIYAAGRYEIKGIKGIYAGRTIPLNNGTLTIGSGSGAGLLIQDRYVSRQHCAVRYNYATNFYEVFDNSSNGVYLSSGVRLQKGVYNAVKRGEIICIGSMAQQFQLL